MRKLAWAGFATALALTPAVAQAQTCIGVPIGAGSFALAGEVGFFDGGKTYGGVGTANLAAPISLQARVDVVKVDDVDESTTVFGGQAAYRMVEAQSYSVCPLVGASYMSEGEEGAEFSALQIPIGVGFGVALPVSGLDLSAFATPALLISRISGEILGTEFDETETDFGAEIGARLRTGPIFFGGSVLVTNAEGSDTEFRVGVGLAFGGSR